jgi:hypothetical protein
VSDTLREDDSVNQIDDIPLQTSHFWSQLQSIFLSSSSSSFSSPTSNNNNNNNNNNNIHGILAHPHMPIIIPNTNNLTATPTPNTRLTADERVARFLHETLSRYLDTHIDINNNNNNNNREILYEECWQNIPRKYEVIGHSHTNNNNHHHTNNNHNVSDGVLLLSPSYSR